MLAGRSLLDTGPRELLSGTVERVTFHSEESGFAVLRVAVRGRRDFVTVVGQAARISAGEAIQASGSWVNDSTHGLQFKAAHLQTAAPTTAEGMERFLGSGLVKGIGPGLARRLVAAFGPEVFDVIEQKIALIRARAGISYALTEAMDDGHCGLPREELLGLAEKLLEVEQPILVEALTSPSTRSQWPGPRRPSRSPRSAPWSGRPRRVPSRPCRHSARRAIRCCRRR